MNATATTRYIGIDFEFANRNRGSICAYGLAFEDGTREHGFVRLHADAPEQHHTRFHGITQEQTDSGAGFETLHARIAGLIEANPADEKLIFVAHDLKSDRRAWHSAQLQHGLEALPMLWIDSIPIARAELKVPKGKGGIAAMAERYGLTINHHNPADDAFVALEIVLRNPATKNIISDSDPSQRAKV